MSAHSLPLPFVEPPTTRARRRAWPLPVEPAAVPHTIPKPPCRRAVWLAMHLRNWPMHAALSVVSEPERSALASRPLAVVDSDRRGTIAACNELAKGHGIRQGHSLNAAIAMRADTKFLTRQPQRELDLLQEVADIASTYTSSVQVQPPNELLLEVRGSFRLFGGMVSLLDQVKKDFESRGFKPQIAVSSTSQSALWIARSTSMSVVPPRTLIPTIARLPVSLLHWPAELELRLARFGVLCIGDLLKLPRGGLARRIGHDRLAELDHAVGRHPQIRKAHRPTEQFNDRILLDFEIETTGLLGRIIERHLFRLREFLTSRNLAVDEVLIDLLHREQPTTAVRIGLAAPTADVAHMASLLHEQLARTALCAPVTEIRLRVTHLKPAPSVSRELFRATRGDTAAATTQQQARLLEQLRSRLGAQAVASLEAAADYRPESAQVLAPAQIGEIPRSPSTLSATLPPRPLWLLPEPRSLCSKRRDGPELPQLQGPEVIKAGWWDGHDIARSYFHVRSPLGARAWVYEDLECAGRWSLQGLFG
jgi:protein ImuB